MPSQLLRLSGHVHVAATADLLYDDLAVKTLVAADEAVERRGTFHLAVSGGSTPEKFYMRLITDPRYRDLPWKQTHLWIVDERCVPEDDEQSNIKMIRESLTDHAPIRKRCVHPMPVLADAAADRYEAELRETFEMSGGSGDLPQIDFVLLGMGGDGHTASLFPHSPAAAVTDRLIASNTGPKVTPPDRLTMTFPLLNAARYVAVLITGEKKTAMLQRVDQQLRTGGPDPQSLPITGIEAGGRRLGWYLDAAAAGEQGEQLNEA